MDTMTRWIGPIPNTPVTGWTDPDDPFCLEYFRHGPVPAPSAGAYLPIPRDERAAEIGCPEPAGQPFQAHNPTGSGPSTPLVLTPEGWWIGAPARPSRRVFRLLAETGSPLEGALPEEIAAVEAWRPTGVPAWKARLSWEWAGATMTPAQFLFLTIRNHADRGFVPCGIGGTTPYFWHDPAQGIIAESGDQWQRCITTEEAEHLGVTPDNLPSLASWTEAPQPRWDDDTSQPAPQFAGQLGGPFHPSGPKCVGAEVRPGELWWAY